MRPSTENEQAYTSAQTAKRRSHESIGQPRNSVALSIAEARNTLPDPVPDSAHPREFSNSLQSLPSRVRKQIIEFNPLKSPFLDLYFDLEHTQDKALALGGAFLAIAAGVPLPIIFVVFSKIIDEFPPSEDAIRQRITELLGVAVAYFVVTTGYTCAFSRVGERIAFTTRERLLKCLLQLDQEYFDTHDLDVTGLLTSKVETIQVGTSEKAGIFLQSLSYFVAAFVVGFILNAKLTGILLAAVIPLTVCIVAFGSGWVTTLATRAGEFTDTASGIAESALRAVRVVQAFDLGEKICEQYAGQLSAATALIVRKQVISACMLGCIYFVAYAANGLAFYVGSILSTSGGEAGTIYAVCLLILDASFIVGQFAPFLNIFATAASSGQEIRTLVQESRRQRQTDRYTTKRTAVDIAGHSIEATEVSFAYPARPAQKVLNNVNIRFESGCLNAVVGTSGGGKSTLISLILGIYDKYDGKVIVSGQDLRTVDMKSLRSQISIVDQECVLFSGSLYDNICYGLAGTEISVDEKKQRVDEAVTAAGVDFLDKLPSGLSTVVDNSLQLSGGQKQRICLARALVKRPAVLILDEPTSALDANSEALVAKTVKRVAEGGTLVIMIAHRLSTVLDADKVFVFDDGQVAESGSPDELTKPGTIFYALLQSQYDGDMPAETESDPKQTIDVKPNELSLSMTESESDLNEDEAKMSNSHGVKHPTRRALSSLLRPDRLWVLAGVSFSVITGCLIIGEAIAFGNLVELLNGASNGNPSRSGINFFCLIFFILACIALVAYSASGSCFGVASSRFTSRAQARMLKNLLRQDLEWFSATGRSVHGLMARLSTDTGNLSGLSGVALGTIFSITASMLGGVILSFAVAWRIAIVLISCVPVLAAAGFLRVRILAKSEENQRNAYNTAAGIAAESYRNIRTVTTLGLEEIVMRRYKDALESPYKHRLKFTVSTNALLAFSFAITYFVYALAYWWGAKNVREGYYAAREFFIVLPALLFSAQSAGQAFSLSPEITKARSAARSVAALLNVQPSILEQETTETTAKSSSASTLSSRRHEKAASRPKIQFDNVAMRYKKSDSTLAIKNVSFSIGSGETVALVGPSGAGKSTIVALIERFYDPVEGTIMVDGIDIRELDPTVLRAKIGLVPQEPQFFPGSIKHNLIMSMVGEEQQAFAKVQQACTDCGLHDFISSLPEGYDTECSSASSTKLSGGQQQRLAIARAIARGPEILLLDEPTSALDAHSERDVQSALDQASAGRTTIIVAHRLASIKHVDKIIVFDHGRVAEEGTHDDLMTQAGLYASMAKAQSLS